MITAASTAMGLVTKPSRAQLARQQRTALLVSLRAAEGIQRGRPNRR